MKMDRERLISEYSKGNPGAVAFLSELLNLTAGVENSIPIACKLDECPTLRGTNLYVLWNDLCDRDMAKVATLCKLCPNDILEDACNRQDYSGRKIIEKYLK